MGKRLTLHEVSAQVRSLIVRLDVYARGSGLRYAENPLMKSLPPVHIGRRVKLKIYCRFRLFPRYPIKRAAKPVILRHYWSPIQNQDSEN